MEGQPEKSSATSTGLQENVAALLSYLLGLITGIIFLVIEKENRFVRFHAFQSVFVSVALIIINTVLLWIPILGWALSVLMGPLSLILWLLLMYKAYKGEYFKLPVVGNLAEQQLQ